MWRPALALAGVVPTVWIVFALRYAGRDDRLTDRRIGLFAVEPVVFGTLVLTNPAHELVWTRATIDTASAVPVLGPAFAVGYYAHVAFTLNRSPIPSLDLTPFAFVVTAFFFALALFRLDLLDRTAIARQQALETTGDGLVVVDADGVIVDADDRRGGSSTPRRNRERRYRRCSPTLPSTLSTAPP